MSKQLEYKNFIKDQLRNGIIDTEKICGLFCTKFDKARQTFYNHWEIAKNEYENEAKAIENEKSEVYKEQQKDAVKRGVLTKLEAIEILTNQAKGTASKIKVDGKDKILIPNFYDRRGAIEMIGKMEGWFADGNNDKPLIINISSNGIELKSDEI